MTTQQIDHDWALIQAVENARLLRRSEHRKMEAQVSTKCLMRADARRDRDAVKKAKLEQTTGGAADATDTKALGKKKALKRVINNKASHKRERAMRRMYGDLTPEEIEQMNNSNRVDSKKKKKAKKKMEEEHGEGTATPSTDGASAPASPSSGSAAIAEKMELAKKEAAVAEIAAAQEAADMVKLMQEQQDQEMYPDDLEESMAGLASPLGGAKKKKPFGVVFKPYGGDVFGTRGKYTEGMVYQSRLTRNNKKKKGLLSAFFDPGRPKVVTPREEEDDVMSEISVDLSSKQRCAATLCNLSSIPANISNLVNEGALDALVKLAHGDDTSVAHNCAVTLCNISADSTAALQLVRGNSISSIVHGGTPFDAILALTHSENEAVRSVCLMTLFRLSQIPGLEAGLVSGNIVPALMRLRHDSDVCALTMARTVFNLSNVKEVYLRIEKVIQAAVTVASSATTIEQMICAARTFKTMGNKIDLRARLLEEGVMAATTGMLTKSTDPSSMDIVDVKKSKILTRLCCSILHDLASYPRNRLAMVREKIVGIVVNLANVPNQEDTVRGICAGVISELAQSEGNQVQVINQGLGVSVWVLLLFVVVCCCLLSVPPPTCVCFINKSIVVSFFFSTCYPPGSFKISRFKRSSHSIDVCRNIM